MGNRVAIAAVVAAVVAMSSAPARADDSLNVRVRTTGVIAVIWHGDPRADAPNGNVRRRRLRHLPPIGEIDLELNSDGSTGFGLAEPEPAIVRVRRTSPGSAAGGCTDLLPMDIATHVDDVTEGQLTFVFQASACRAAAARDRARRPRPGPPPSLHHHPRIAQRARTLDLTGRTPFIAGSFSGTVISTVYIRLKRAQVTQHQSSNRSSDWVRIDFDRGAACRFAGLLLSYRLQPLGGSIVSEFAGLHSPACQVLDACGVRGRSTLELKSDAGEMQILAVRRRGKRKPSVGSMLGAVRRGGLRAEGFAYFPRMTARVSEQVTLADGQTCTDSVFADAPDVQVRRGAGRMAIVLTSAGDSVRTRCPGPTEDDATHTEVLARASFALRDVGRRVLPLGLGTPRTFSAPASPARGAGPCRWSCASWMPRSSRDEGGDRGDARLRILLLLAWAMLPLAAPAAHAQLAIGGEGTDSSSASRRFPPLSRAGSRSTSGPTRAPAAPPRATSPVVSSGRRPAMPT